MTGHASESRAERAERLRVAFWTPLPPLGSGIADYSRDVIEALRDDYDIVAVVDDLVAGALVAPEGTSVLPASVARGMEFDLSVYHLGNHIGFHRYMVSAMLERPGVLVLHDLSVFDLVVALCGGTGSVMFAEELELDSGGRYRPEALPMLELGARGMEVDRLEVPMCRRFVTTSLMTLVNSAWAAGTLAERYGVQASVVPMPGAHRGVTPEQIRPPPDARGAVVFGVFGGLAPHKRTVEVLRAFLEIARTRDDCLLVLAGRSDYPEVAAEIEDVLTAAPNEIRRRITFETDLDGPRYDALLADCDVVIGLRWPTAGEMSAIIPQALSNGSVVVLSDVPQYRELAGDWCWLVSTDPVVEADALVLAMERALDDRDLLHAAQASARAYADVHLGRGSLGSAYRRHLDEVWRVLNGGSPIEVDAPAPAAMPSLVHEPPGRVASRRDA